jgi:serine phosphatase RsbU (regulator of sigma subunit)
MAPAFGDLEHTTASGKKPIGRPEVALGHYLVGIEGREAGKLFEIGPDPLTIGRDAKQTLVFSDDAEVSRVHARVSLAGNAVVVEDLGSTNGTFVNAKRITSAVTLREGSVLRVGRQILKYERRDRAEVTRSQELSRDLLRAADYVHSILPPPIPSGAVTADWSFVPSTQLGGDAFGYYWLDSETFVIYLMDVSGHGVGAAMHSVTVMNVLRQRALPDVDFANPAAVLSSLNKRFQMDSHSGMYFTMWYGVYRTGDRTLAYSAAGHHPAYVVHANRDAAQPVGMSSLMIGVMPDDLYDVQSTIIPPGSVLYLFSDGVFEVATKAGPIWTLSDFLSFLLQQPLAGVPEPERLYRAVREVARSGLLDDDFSLVALTFQ